MDSIFLFLFSIWLFGISSMPAPPPCFEKNHKISRFFSFGKCPYLQIIFSTFLDHPGFFVLKRQWPSWSRWRSGGQLMSDIFFHPHDTGYQYLFLIHFMKMAKLYYILWCSKKWAISFSIHMTLDIDFFFWFISWKWQSYIIVMRSIKRSEVVRKRN